MNARTVRRAVVIAAGVCLLLGATVAGAVWWQIRRSVQACLAEAQRVCPHPGDDTAALLAYVESGAHPLEERNLAVWTLGRLRDPAALPGLTALYTGDPCRHERDLCQYELAKAIRRCTQARHQ